MTKTSFDRVFMVAQAFIEYLSAHPEGITLREAKRHIKLLLERHGLDIGAYVYYDQMVLDILDTADAIKTLIEPREPTRLVVNFREVADDK